MKVLLKVFPPRCSRTRCSRRAGTSAARRPPVAESPVPPSEAQAFQGSPEGETAEAPPAAEKARLFRGSGAIGGCEAPGNRNAATVFGKPPQVSPAEPAKWPESFFPATLSASPRGIAAAAYAENMPPACFLNAAAAEKIPLREPECATPEARRARPFGVPRRNPAERLRWGEEGQRSGVQKAFSRRAF